MVNEMTEQYCLTTTDNPYSPFTRFKQWYKFDYNVKGYRTCEYLDKMANTSPSFSDELNNRITDEAIDDIVMFDELGLRTGGELHYIKVIEDDYDLTGIHKNWDTGTNKIVL